MKEITEQDIFDFVFSSERLDSEKYLEIKNNSQYIEAVNFYQKLKAELATELKDEEKISLKEKIPIYNQELIIPLFKKKDNKENEYRLVAASKYNRENSVDTFIDSTGRFIIRIAYEKDKMKIFPIFHDDIGEKRYRLKLIPDIFEGVFDRNSIPIIVDTLQGFKEIQKIELTLA